MIIDFDHVALTVRNLEETVEAYRVLLGREPNWVGTLEGARHAWFQLPNMALDINAPHGEGPAAAGMRAQLDKWGEGIWGIGFAVADLDAATRTLERRGVALFPSAVTRSRADNGDERSWRIAVARRNSTHGVAQFFVERPPGTQAWPVSPPIGEELAAIAGLDHVVIQTPNPDRAAAHYGARLGLDLRLDRSNEQWGSRLLFFRCGGLVVEIGASLKSPPGDGRDRFGGLAWRMRDAGPIHARLGVAGFDISELRKGRKPGTRVFTVRTRTANIPTLMLEAGSDAVADS
jgi:catechol 2,3-dioxygenase-like lactoylglutathione lyase family enzyme